MGLWVFTYNSKGRVTFRYGFDRPPQTLSSAFVHCALRGAWEGVSFVGEGPLPEGNSIRESMVNFWKTWASLVWFLLAFALSSQGQVGHQRAGNDNYVDRHLSGKWNENVAREEMHAAVPSPSPRVTPLASPSSSSASASASSSSYIGAGRIPLPQQQQLEERRKLMSRPATMGSYSYSYVQYSMAFPTSRPSSSPSQSSNPTSHPTRAPTSRNTRPTSVPTAYATSAAEFATKTPTRQPLTFSPSGEPSSLPTGQPTGQPTAQPTSHPTTSQPSGSMFQDTGLTDRTGPFFLVGGGNAKSSSAFTRQQNMTRDASSTVGLDAGGFAISKSKIFLAGDTATAAFSKSGTMQPNRTIAALKGAAFCSNLATNDVFALADANLAPLTGPGIISFLLAIDDVTMARAAAYKRHVGLNTPISVGYHSGIFSGYNRVVIVDRDTLAAWNINLSNGHVIYLGNALCKWAYTKSWASWGIAEFSYEKKVHLLYGSAGGGGIERQSVNDGLRNDGDPTKGEHYRSIEMVYDGNLGDLVSFSVDITSRRWYFQYTGVGDFGRKTLTLGYADAVFAFSVPTGQPTGQPTRKPSGQPSRAPSGQPASQPSLQPTAGPSQRPSGVPTRHPYAEPTGQPSGLPTCLPSQMPATSPTAAPTRQPTSQPSRIPSGQPTTQPTTHPTTLPSGQPTMEPSLQPTGSPTSMPSGKPSPAPVPLPSPPPTSSEPTGSPTSMPTTSMPSQVPTPLPTANPTDEPTIEPTHEPSPDPTAEPTFEPSIGPTTDPTQEPTEHPTCDPTALPTLEPTAIATTGPTIMPTGQPTGEPSGQPTEMPSGEPTSTPTNPTGIPSALPSSQPTRLPTGQPSLQPSRQPTGQPSRRPSSQPAGSPTGIPSSQPTSSPTNPTGQPSSVPTAQPSVQPSCLPTGQPSSHPTLAPARPTGQPSTQPTSRPTSPTGIPSGQPTRLPSAQPSSQPTNIPSAQPSTRPTLQPTGLPSGIPSSQPSMVPSRKPTGQPTRIPSRQPSSQPTRLPSQQPTGQPSRTPTGQPSRIPSRQPTGQPSRIPSSQPTSRPTSQPTGKPSRVPTRKPTGEPTRQPSAQPSERPSSQPTTNPSSIPTRQPTSEPSQQPLSRPTSTPTDQPTSQPTRQPFLMPTSIPTGQPTRMPQRPTGQPSSQPTRCPSSQPSTMPTTNKPTLAPTALEPKMFLKNNVMSLSVTHTIRSNFFTSVTMSRNRYKYSFSRALYVAVCTLTGETKSTSLSFFVDSYSLGGTGLVGAFRDFTSLTTIPKVTSSDGTITTLAGVTLVYNIRVPMDPTIINDDGTVNKDAYTPWAAAKKTTITAIITAISVAASESISPLMSKSSDLSLTLFSSSRRLRDVEDFFTYSKEFAKRQLQAAASSPFLSATADPPAVADPSLAEGATWSPTMAPTEVALPSIGLSYNTIQTAVANTSLANLDLRRSLTLNVTLVGPSYRGLIICAAFSAPLNITEAGINPDPLYFAQQVKAAVFNIVEQFLDSADPTEFHIMTIGGLQPATTYYTGCQLEVQGFGTSYFAKGGIDDASVFSCQRAGACFTNSQILANQVQSQTLCCKTITWTNSPLSVYWDVFNKYTLGDTSYYFKFALSDPPQDYLKLTVHKSLSALSPCAVKTSTKCSQIQSNLDKVILSTVNFIYDKKSAAYAGSFFMSMNCAPADSEACFVLGGAMVLSLDFTSRNGSAAQYTLPSSLNVGILDSNAERPPPNFLPSPKGVQFSDSGSFASIMFDSQADIVNAQGRIFAGGSTFVCSKLFTFQVLNGPSNGQQSPQFLNADLTVVPAIAQFDVADYINCTWINNTAVRMAFGSLKPAVSPLKDSDILAALPVVNTLLQLKGGIIPSQCPVPGFGNSLCSNWTKNAAQTSSFAASSTVLASKATVTAPKFVSACNDPTLDAGSSAGNGGRQFVNVNWVIKFVKDPENNLQVDMLAPLNSPTDKYRDMGLSSASPLGTNPYARGYSVTNGVPAFQVGHEIPGRLVSGQYDAYSQGSYGYNCPTCLPGPRVYNIEQVLLLPPPLFVAIPRVHFSTPGTTSTGSGYFTDIMMNTYDVYIDAFSTPGQTRDTLTCNQGGGCGSGTYQVYFYLENYLGSGSHVVAYMFVSDARNVPSVTIAGSSVVSLRTNDALLLSSTGSLSNCTTATSLVYQWKLYNLGTTTPALGTSANPTLDTTSKDPRKYKLDPYSLNFGSYTATLSVVPIGPAPRSQFSDPTKDPLAYIPNAETDYIKLSVNVLVGHGPVAAFVAGGYNRNVSIDHDMILDASKSRDYDFGATTGDMPPSSTLTFKWGCVGISRNVSGFDCGPLLTSALPEDKTRCDSLQMCVNPEVYKTISDEKKATCADLLKSGEAVCIPATSQYKVYFPAWTLQVLQSYAVSVFVSTTDGRYDSKTVSLSVAPRGTPAVIVTSTAIKFNPTSPLKVFGTISAGFATSARWSVFYSGIQVDPVFTTQSSKNFTLAEAAQAISFPVAFQINQFISGRNYNFRLEAWPTANPALIAASEVVLLVNSPPAGGKLIIDNGVVTGGCTAPFLARCINGTALTTKFTLTAALWTTDPENLPLQYEFNFRLDNAAPELLVQALSQKTFVITSFPAGYPQNNYEIIVSNAAYDKYLAVAQIQGTAVVQNPEGDQSAFLGKALSSGLAAGSASGDPDKTYQIINNVATAVNSVNCTGFGAEQCKSRFNRSSCLTIPLTCESCLDGFNGVIGPSNTKCFKGDFGRNGMNCTSDDMCLYNYCDPITQSCAPPLLQCPSNTPEICSGHGRCQYSDTSGNIKLSCTISDVFCRATCICDDGYGAQDCSLDADGLIARDASRGLMCDSLITTAAKQDKSAQLLDALVGTLLSSYNPSEVTSDSSKAKCKNALAIMTNIAASGYLKGAKPATVQFLTVTVSGFVTPPQASEAGPSNGGGANTAVQNLIGGVTKTTVPGQAPEALTTPNVRVAVDNAQLSSLNGGSLAPPSTAAEAAYGVLPPSIGLPADGFAGCGMPKGSGYAQLSTMQWGQNPYAGSNDIKSPVLRFSNSKSSTNKGRRLLTRNGRRMLKLTSRTVKLLGIPLYYITMQYAARQELNFSQDLTKKPKRLMQGEKQGNFSLPKCQLNQGGKFVDCKNCNVSSYTNTNVTFGCFDLTQLCPPGSDLYKKANARRHLTAEEYQDFESDLNRYEDEDAEMATMSDRQWMLYDQSWAWGSHTEEQRLFYEKEDYYDAEINRRRLQGDDDGNTEPSSADDAVSNFGALLAAILAQLAATLSSNPFALDPSKSIPILTFISVLGFIICSGFFWFLRWDTYDHNFELYVKEAALKEKRKEVAVNLAKGSSNLPKAKATFSISSAFTSVTRRELRANVITQGATAVATTNTTVAANIGDTRLEVGSIDGFKVGMYIEIGTAGSVDRCKIAAFGSIVTDTPMLYYHPRGSPVVGYELNAHGGTGKGDNGKTGYGMGSGKGSTVSSKEAESVGYNSTEDDTASTGDLSSDGSVQRSYDGDANSKIRSLAAGYMDEFMSLVLPQRSLLSDSNFLMRFLTKITTKHTYMAPFGATSMYSTRVVRWCLLCQMVMITLFIDTLIFGTFFPDDTTCPSLKLKKLCIGVPSQIGQKSLCLWTPDADPVNNPTVTGGSCALRPPPSSITFTIMVAVICTILSTPVDIFMALIMETYCRRRPNFDNWGWSSDRIVGTSTEAFKNNIEDKQGALGELMEEVGKQREDAFSEVQKRKQEAFMAREVYVDFISPVEEARTLLQKVKTYLTEDLEGGALPWENTMSKQSDAEKLAKMRCVQKRLGIHSDLTSVPLSLRQWMNYGTPLNRLVKKIAKARTKASQIESELEGFSDLESNLKDICLTQRFVLECLTPIRRFALSMEFFIFDGTPEDCAPLGWAVSWTFYVMILAFFWYWLFAWGVKQGGTVLQNWGNTYLISFVMDAFGVSIIRILVLDVISIDAVRPQLRVIRRVLEQVGITYCQENPDRTNEVRVVQTLSPACRAARTFAAKTLASAKILRHLDDLDVERCRDGRTSRMGTIIFFLVAVPAVAALINEGIASTVFDLVSNMFVTAVVIVGSSLNDVGPKILVIPFVFLSTYLIYRFFILGPATQRLQLIAQGGADGSTRRWKTSRRTKGKVSLLAYFSNLGSACLDGCAKCIVRFSYAELTKKATANVDTAQIVAQQWQKMNLPSALQGRVLSEVELKKQTITTLRLVNDSDYNKNDLIEVFALLPKEILAMKMSHIHNDWKWQQPWLKNVAEQYDPKDVVVTRNARRQGPGLAFRDSAITQNPMTACQRMLQNYIGDAMTPDDDFQYFSNLVDSTKFDNFIYTPELVNMVNKSWESFYPGGVVMSETERLEMRDHLIQWILATAGPAGQGSRFGTFRRWYISECNRIARIRYSLRKKQFVPAGMVRSERETVEAAWLKDQEALGAKEKDSSVSSSSSSDSGLDAFEGKKFRDDASSSQGSFELQGFGSDSSVLSKGRRDSYKSASVAHVRRLQPNSDGSSGSDSDSSAHDAWAKGQARGATKMGFGIHGSSSSENGNDDLDVDGWESDSGESNGSYDEDVKVAAFDPRPFDINRGKSMASMATELTVGTLSSGFGGLFSGAMAVASGVTTTNASPQVTLASSLNPLLSSDSSSGDEMSGEAAPQRRRADPRKLLPLKKRD